MGSGTTSCIARRSSVLTWRMRALAVGLWVLAAAWVVAALVGAEQFQEMYGGTSGLQFFALTAVIAVVPILLGWWAFRRGRTRSDHPD